MRPAPPAAAAVLIRPQWKVLIVDEDSRKLIDDVVKEDDILNENITSAPPRLLRELPADDSQTSSASRTGARRRPTWTPSTS